jgi:hypothetical protein
MPSLQVVPAGLAIICILACRLSALANRRENCHDLPFEASCAIACFTVITEVFSPVQYYHEAQPLFCDRHMRIR